jgi:hypothetical protein
MSRKKWLQDSPLLVGQVRPRGHRYRVHEVSGLMVFFVVDSSTGDLVSWRHMTRRRYQAVINHRPVDAFLNAL